MRLDEATCRRLFGAARVARLASTGPTGPHIVPIVFAIDGNTIVHAVDQKPKSSRMLQRLSNLATTPRTALLADRYADDWDTLWWVRADATAKIVEDPSALADVVASLRERYPQYVDDPPAGPAVSFEVDRWTGWAASPSAIEATSC